MGEFDTFEDDHLYICASNVMQTREKVDIEYFERLQRKKILTAIHLMGAGVSVSEASYSLGYKSPSAFTAMFRREMGKTPSEFLIKN